MNREEIIIGFIFALTFFFSFGWLTLPVSIICGLLWALSGAPYQSKVWRRWIVPFIVCCTSYLLYKQWYVWVSLPLGALVQSIGYGIPSKFPPDEGSALGRFWYEICPRYANVLTRATIYILLVTAFLPVYLNHR